MQTEENKSNSHPVDARYVSRMVYVEDQACNLPKVERASVNNKPVSTSSNNERIVHG